MARRSSRGGRAGLTATDTFGKGYQIKKARALLDTSWKAAYGLELIRITQEANELGKQLGVWIDPYYPTEEEFLEARRIASRPEFGGRSFMASSEGLRIRNLAPFARGAHTVRRQPKTPVHPKRKGSK